jgi:hypothetical protein
MDLASTARCKAADGFVAGATAVVATKAATCKYYERVLKENLKHQRLKFRSQYKQTAPQGLTAKALSDWLDEQVDTTPEIVEAEHRFAVAEASRYYWDYLIEALKEMGKRVDSAGILIAVEEKRQPVIGMGAPNASV